MLHEVKTQKRSQIVKVIQFSILTHEILKVYLYRKSDCPKINVKKKKSPHQAFSSVVTF